MDTTDRPSRAAVAVGEVLEHYGIKGMKWGIRRSRRELARERGESLPKSGSSQGETKTELRVTGPMQGVSNTELKEMVERLNMEKRYSELYSELYGTKPKSGADPEMKSEVERLRLESEYKKLTAKPPSKKKRAAVFIAGLAANEAKSLLLKGKPGPVVRTIDGLVLNKGVGKHRKIKVKK